MCRNDCSQWAAVGWLSGGGKLHEKSINIMHKNAIKRTHAPNGLTQCNSHLFKMFPFLFAIFTHSLSFYLSRSYIQILYTLLLLVRGNRSNFGTGSCSFWRCASVHIAHIIIQTSNELYSTTVQRIRSINAENEWANERTNEWLNGIWRLHNLCCGKQSPTKLTAVIFARF